MTFDQAQSARLGQRTAIESTVVRMFAGIDLPEVSWTGQLIWRTDTKILQVYNGTAYEDVAAGNAGALTFVGDTVPVAQSAGDIWYDSSGDINHPYRAASAGADEIAVGEWESIKFTGDVNPNQLVPGSLGSEITLNAKLKTADSGSRVEIGPSGVRVYDENDDPQTVLGSDGQSTFRGDAEVGGITVTGGASLRSTENEISRGGRMVLQEGVTASATPPSALVDWYKIQLTGYTPQINESVTGITKLGSNWYVSGAMTGTSTASYVHEFDSNGVYTDLGHMINLGGIYRFTLLDINTAICLKIKDNSDYYVFVRDTREVDPITTGAYYEINRHQNNYYPAIGRINATQFYIAERRSGTETLYYRIYDVDIPNKTLSFNSGYQVGFGWNEKTHIVGAYQGTADIGVTREFFSIRAFPKNTTLEHVRAFSGNSGDNDYHFPHPDVDPQGLEWDGTNFWTLGADWCLYRHEGGNNVWVSSIGGEEMDWHTGFTWEDTDAAGAGTHETSISVLKKFTMKRRARVTITTPPINDTGGTDDPDSISVYMARSETEPARTALKYQGSSSTASLEVTDWDDNVRVPPDPASNPNAFPTTVTPAEIESSAVDGSGDPYVELKGSGVARIGDFSTDAAGAVSFAAGPLRVLACGSVTSGTSDGSGDYTITHNLGRTDYLVLVQPRGHTNSRVYHVMAHNTNDFRVRLFNSDNAAVTSGSVNFNWFIIGDETG